MGLPKTAVALAERKRAGFLKRNQGIANILLPYDLGSDADAKALDRVAGLEIVGGHRHFFIGGHELVLTISVAIGAGIAGGFLKQIGADLYTYLKGKCKAYLNDEHAGFTTAHILVCGSIGELFFTASVEGGDSRIERFFDELPAKLAGANEQTRQKIGKELLLYMAREDTWEVLLVEPLSEQCAVNVAVACYNCNDAKNGIRAAHICLASHPESPRLHEILAACYLAQDNGRLASELLRRAIKLTKNQIPDPKKSTQATRMLLYDLNTCLLADGDYDACLATLLEIEKSAELVPLKHPEVLWYRRALVYAYMNRIRDAIECFEKTLAMAPTVKAQLLADEMIEPLISKSAELRRFISCVKRADLPPQGGVKQVKKARKASKGRP